MVSGEIIHQVDLLIQRSQNHNQKVTSRHQAPISKNTVMSPQHPASQTSIKPGHATTWSLVIQSAAAGPQVHFLSPAKGLLKQASQFPSLFRCLAVNGQGSTASAFRTGHATTWSLVIQSASDGPQVHLSSPAKGLLKQASQFPSLFRCFAVNGQGSTASAFRSGHATTWSL